MSKKKTKISPNTVALNRHARHDYAIEDNFEAGIQLYGWEVKSIRAGKMQVAEAHVIVKKQEVWLLNANINPLDTASTHVLPEPSRTRKLLLTKREINKITGAISQKGYTCVPLRVYWKKNHVKIEIALAKGKKTFDKRESAKDHDWKRQKERLFKKAVR